MGSLFDVPIAFAFTAGMVAAFNPCGAAMLPAYIGYQLGDPDVSADPIKALLRGFYLGGVVTAGFVFLSLVIGVIVVIGAGILLKFIPFAGLSVGVCVVLLGGWLLISGRNFGIYKGIGISPGRRRGFKDVFLFGVAYAICSLGCAFPVFLAAVGILGIRSLGDMELLPFVTRFSSYGLGMGFVLTGVTLGVIFLKEAVSHILRKIFPYFTTAGNLSLIVSGSYLIWYWTLGDGSLLLFD